MNLTTITGITTTELADEIWEALDSLINERLYESGVADEDFTAFKNRIAAQLVESLEEIL